MRSSLTGRERVTRAIEHRDHDRVLRHETFWGETIARWQSEEVFGNADTVIDMLECDTAEIWREKDKPALLASKVELGIHGAVREHAQARESGRWRCLVSVETFRSGAQAARRRLRWSPRTRLDPGHFANAHRSRPARLRGDSRGWRRARRVWIYGDVAYKHATMCPPAMYRELVFPDHRRLARWAHERGMKFVYHTDGDINSVHPLLGKRAAMFGDEGFEHDAG